MPPGTRKTVNYMIDEENLISEGKVVQRMTVAVLDFLRDNCSPADALAVLPLALVEIADMMYGDNRSEVARDMLEAALKVFADIVASQGPRESLPLRALPS